MKEDTLDVGNDKIQNKERVCSSVAGSKLTSLFATRCGVEDLQWITRELD